MEHEHEHAFAGGYPPFPWYKYIILWVLYTNNLIELT